jgi:hypothetical protein
MLSGFAARSKFDVVAAGGKQAVSITDGHKQTRMKASRKNCQCFYLCSFVVETLVSERRPQSSPRGSTHDWTECFDFGFDRRNWKENSPWTSSMSLS